MYEVFFSRTQPKPDTICVRQVPDHFCETDKRYRYLGDLIEDCCPTSLWPHEWREAEADLLDVLTDQENEFDWFPMDESGYIHWEA